MDRPLKVVVAGASGFVGRALVKRLSDRYEVVGLTRSHRLPEPGTPGRPGVTFKTCDLFSLLQVEEAVAGADIAFYLVHSMLPHAHLVQGSFADFDLILADNFARACRRHGVKQIIYLGGLIPELPEGEELSLHLQSRREVEETFRASGVPFTSLRASIVIGPNGSSFRIVDRLVRRLPFMVTPRWTVTPTQPIALSDVVELLDRCIGDPDALNRVADVGGPDVLTYRDLILKTAELMGVKRPVAPIPVLTPQLSRLWVQLVTGVPKQLISPLVESLSHPMVVRDDWLLRKLGRPLKSIDDSIREALVVEERNAARAPGPKAPFAHDVRSVQRFIRPRQLRAFDVANEYFEWAKGLGFVTMKIRGDTKLLFIRGYPKPILEMTRSGDRSTEDRELYYLTGGALAQPDIRPRGRFEFREVLGGKHILAAVHAFTPKLPWQLYKYSQAMAHLWVMTGFGKHLERLAKHQDQPADPRSAVTSHE